MTWSAGSTSSTGSSALGCAGSPLRAACAASAMAGAVLRPKGSSSVARGSMCSCRSCSATRKRCASLHTTTGAPAVSPCRRSTVCCSIVRAPVSGSSCFGYSSRDSGHSRVPAPPDRMTGVIMPSVAGQGSAAADGVVGEAEAAEHGGLVEIAAVEDHGRLEYLFQPIKVRAAELLPLGDDGKGVRPLRGLIGALGEREPGAAGEHPLRFGGGYGIVGLDSGACLEQQLDQGHGGCLAHVIRVGFECQPPQREVAALEIPREVALHLLEQHLLLLVVHRFHGVQDLRLVPRFVRRADECLHVLGETGTTVAGARIDEA